MDLLQKAIKLGCIIKSEDYYLYDIQKWLREVHKIDVYSTWGTYLEKTVWYFYNSKISIGATFSSKKHWNTYEEALEAGLFEALNLIKNE